MSLSSALNSVRQGATNPNSGAYCSLNMLLKLRWQAQHLTLPKARSAVRPQAGAHKSRLRGRGMEFSEVRVYQPGDDVRSIDWRVTARRQTPHTRLYDEEKERPVMILCDQSASQFFGSREAFKSVRAAQAAALIAWTALAHNDRVGGIVFSDKGHDETRPARHRKNVLRLLHTINRYNQALPAGLSSAHDTAPVDKTPNPGTASPPALTNALKELYRVTKPGALLVLISDFFHLDAAGANLIKQLSQHNECLLVQTYDALERALPPPGTYPVSDGNETRILDAQAANLRGRYEEWARAKQAQLSTLSRQCRAPLVELGTEQDPAKALQALLYSMGH